MLQLHPSLSFCDVNGRHLFLDLQGDRYFCLDGALEVAWRAALRGDATPSQAEALSSRDLVVRSGGSALEPCDARIATRSALDVPAGAPSWLRACGGVLAAAHMRRRLRRQRFAAIVESFVQSKAERHGANPGLPELAATAADFARLNLVTTTLDQCLSRSLAIGFHLARAGFQPELVLGVRLGPFGAHCWIECDGLLVNDRFDRAGTYQPIRRL